MEENWYLSNIGNRWCESDMSFTFGCLNTITSTVPLMHSGTNLDIDKSLSFFYLYKGYISKILSNLYLLDIILKEKSLPIL